MTQPQNVFKYCPRCGSKHFNFEGSRSFLCSDCGFHYFINSSAAVAGLIENEKGELLLTVRAFNPNKGMLDLPGGFVDPMESAEAALKREIKEELNLEVTEMQYLTSFPNEYVFSNFSVYTTDIAFICKVKGWNNMHIQDDISDIVFVTKQNIDWNNISAGSIKRIIEAFWNL
ncbi:NUDIX hydrolase [Plebeiibacterium sediminum]|uniref:NUDIX domain-containing protein n=1 Tax=Plebeiibacterium sediminum TaxID=2992112 RepID=A0AAE3M4U8_9BACT|nr:NUDIX domain-containing protein [Plebeiobacterium sediminum]MCW3786685.1 NUDIX domain-containing protein [Plebeiobacterium sediminum]